jgi:hypothetical protein
MSLRGAVVYFYAFDVANEIETANVREVLSARPAPFLIRAGTAIPKDVRIYRPLVISPGDQEADTVTGRPRVQRAVKLFDVGALSITYQVPFEVAGLGDLVAFHRLQVGGRDLAAAAEELCTQVTESIRPYLVKPSRERAPAEAYTVFCLESIEGVGAGELSTWAQEKREELAALLLEEPAGRLSPAQVEDTLGQQLSYSKDDLTIVDWDAALVADRSGYFDDVLYVMELANLQLEEFRTLDDRVDAFALQAYDDIERYYASRRFFRMPHHILGALRTIRFDISKIADESANITKFVGDWYLARVYLACRASFHLAHWQSSVEKKIGELDHLYTMVHNELEAHRMLVLEAIIVALFVFDVALILLGK